MKIPFEDLNDEYNSSSCKILHGFVQINYKIKIKNINNFFF